MRFVGIPTFFERLLAFLGTFCTEQVDWVETMGKSEKSNGLETSHQVIERSCPACRESRSTDRWRKADTCFVQCVSCGMVYVREVPLSFVNGEFYEDRTESFYLSDDK